MFYLGFGKLFTVAKIYGLFASLFSKFSDRGCNFSKLLVIFVLGSERKLSVVNYSSFRT
jgi:hypothetical protein